MTEAELTEKCRALIGTDIYTYTASQALGIPQDQVTKEQRQAAKVAILAADYEYEINEPVGYASTSDMIKWLHDEGFDASETPNVYMRGDQRLEIDSELDYVTWMSIDGIEIAVPITREGLILTVSH
jgi:hypothetical protein